MSEKVFHMSEPLNGIALNYSTHLTGHKFYNAKVNEILDVINRRVGNDNEMAFYELSEFITYLSDLIKANPNYTLGDIANLIKYQ